MKHYKSDDIFSAPEFPIAVTRQLQHSQMPEHTHDFIELVIVAEGHAIHQFFSNDHSTTYGLLQGDCFAVLPGETHTYRGSKNFVIYNIAFQEAVFQNQLQELKELPIWKNFFESTSAHERKKRHLLPYEKVVAEGYLNKIMREFSCRETGFQFRIKLALLEILCIIDRANIVSWHPHASEPYSGILKTINYMENIQAQPFDLKYLAKMANMSVSSYTKKFREMTGDSPCEYFIGIKLENIRIDLIKTNLSISELAEKYGFCDTSYMIRRFHRRLGISPLRYRNATKS